MARKVLNSKPKRMDSGEWKVCLSCKPDLNFQKYGSLPNEGWTQCRPPNTRILIIRRDVLLVFGESTKNV